MLTLNDNWIEAFSKGQRAPVFLLTLTCSDSTTHRFL